MKAFPTTDANYEETISAGMDLRDYFAAKAMQAIICKADDRSTTVEEVELWVGHYAYTVADAMMIERSK
jgi:hypothetical protein